MCEDERADSGHADEYGFHPPISKTLGAPCVELRGVSQHYELQVGAAAGSLPHCPHAEAAGDKRDGTGPNRRQPAPGFRVLSHSTRRVCDGARAGLQRAPGGARRG